MRSIEREREGDRFREKDVEEKTRQAERAKEQTILGLCKSVYMYNH